MIRLVNHLWNRTHDSRMKPLLHTRSSRDLFFSLWLNAALTGLSVPVGAASSLPLDFSGNVIDLASALNPLYSADLNDRLDHLNKKSGYAIYLALLPDDPQRSLFGVGWNAFRSNQLESKGASGTLLIVIGTKSRQVEIAVSKNLMRTFRNQRAEEQIRALFHQDSQKPEVAVERAVHGLLTVINPWFYCLDPPSARTGFGPLLVRSPTAEIILFPLAPLLGLVTGAVLMVFTRAGNLPNLSRFFVSGISACVVVIVAAFLIRQRGGIAPGIVYYGAIVGFVVGASVGITRPFWFLDTIRGRKPDENIHPPFYGRG